MRHPALFRHAPREDPGPLLPLFSSAPPKAPEARFAPLAVPRGRADRRADQPQRVARRCNPSRLTSVTPSVPRGRADRRAGLPQRVTSRCNPLRLTSATPSTTPFCPVRARLSHFRDPLPLVSTCFAALAVLRAVGFIAGQIIMHLAIWGPRGPPEGPRDRHRNNGGWQTGPQGASGPPGADVMKTYHVGSEGPPSPSGPGFCFALRVFFPALAGPGRAGCHGRAQLPRGPRGVGRWGREESKAAVKAVARPLFPFSFTHILCPPSTSASLGHLSPLSPHFPSPFHLRPMRPVA